MSDVIDSSGFRANVGIVLQHPGGSVFLGRRTGGKGWQFPQGGVRQGEGPVEAVLRELHEEIGLTEADVLVVGSTERWLHYRLPKRFVRRHQRPVCIGQKQRWFLLRLKREQVAFDFQRTEQPEFDQWRWVSFWEPVREVIYFKRPVYAQALRELAPLAFPAGEPALPEWWDQLARPARRRARTSRAAAH